MSIKSRLGELKYDWEHAPSEQRGALVTAGLALFGVTCAWLLLAHVQQQAIDMSAGATPFDASEPVQEQAENEQGASKVEPAGKAPSSPSASEGAGASSGSEAETPSIDVSAASVEEHEEGCAPIDKLPKVAVANSADLETQLQNLLDARFGGAAGAKAYLDTSQGITVADGETAQVGFHVAVVGADGRDVVQVGVSYAPASGLFGISSATVAATPPVEGAEKGGDAAGAGKTE